MADAVLSLDVIYHLVEDDVFQAHMEMLFDAARHFVIIYSSNENQDPALSYTYIRHRNFLRWVEENANGWKLEEHVPNAFPFKGDVRNESFADFYVFSRASS